MKLAYQHEKKLSYKVKVRNTIVIPPRQEVNIEGEVTTWRNVQNSTRVLEPARSVFPKTGALVSKIMVTPKTSVVPVRIFNPHDEPIQLFRSTTLGLLQEVNRAVGWQKQAQLVDHEEMPDLVHP